MQSVLSYLDKASVEPPYSHEEDMTVTLIQRIKEAWKVFWHGLPPSVSLLPDEDLTWDLNFTRCKAQGETKNGFETAHYLKNSQGTVLFASEEDEVAFQRIMDAGGKV